MQTTLTQPQPQQWTLRKLGHFVWTIESTSPPLITQTTIAPKREAMRRFHLLRFSHDAGYRADIEQRRELQNWTAQSLRRRRAAK